MTNWVEGWKEVKQTYLYNLLSNSPAQLCNIRKIPLQAKHRFQNYGTGVQYVLFSHVGCDSQFWAGHYGSKMTNASVIVDLQSMEDPHDKTPEEKAEIVRFFQIHTSFSINQTPFDPP